MINLPLLFLITCNLFIVVGTYAIYYSFGGVPKTTRTVVQTVLLSTILVIIIGGYDWLIFPCIILITWVRSYTKHHTLFSIESTSILTACTMQIFLSEIAVYLSYTSSKLIFSTINPLYLTWTFCLLDTVLVIVICRSFANNQIVTKLRKSFNTESHGKLFFSFSLICFLIIFAIQVICDLNEYTIKVQLPIILVFLLILILDLFFINTYSKLQKRELMLHEQENINKIFNKHLAELTSNYNQMRAFKHDFQNILLTIKTMASNNQDLQRYLTEVMDQSNIISVSKRDDLEIKKILNTPLHSLILAKVSLANEKKVPLHIEINRPIKDLLVNEVTITRIVSILFDNAIECAEHLAQPQPISFVIDNYGESGYDIIIENYFSANTNTDIEKWFSSYSSKGHGRGIGLCSVKKLIAQEEPLSINTEIVDNKVRFTLMVGGTNA